jgi:hypothetical protein
MEKKVRDSAAIAHKARVTKAGKVLKKWSDDGTDLELLTPGVGLRVRGTIRHLGNAGDFLFVSASREVTCMIFLGSWKSVVVERGGPIEPRVHLRPDLASDHGLTLVPEHSFKGSEMSAVLEQLGLWVKLQTKLMSSFEFPFAGTYWTGTIKEYSPGVFVLANEDADQEHLIDTARCGRWQLERIKEHTIVTLSSRTGDFQVSISDARSNIEAAYKRFALRSTAVH